MRGLVGAALLSVAGMTLAVVPADAVAAPMPARAPSYCVGPISGVPGANYSICKYNVVSKSTSALVTMTVKRASVRRATTLYLTYNNSVICSWTLPSNTASHSYSCHPGKTGTLTAVTNGDVTTISASASYPAVVKN